MPARLVPINPGLIRPIPLERPVLLVGRHLDCDANLPHARVSRRHCCVAQVADRLILRDLGSRNGVRINGVAIDEATLDDGDEVAIGPVLFRFEASAVADNNAREQVIDPPSALEDDSELIPLDDA